MSANQTQPVAAQASAPDTSPVHLPLPAAEDWVWWGFNGTESDREPFLVALLLDEEYRFASTHERYIFEGLEGQTACRLVLKEAILREASYIVLFFRHPYGDPVPNREEVEFFESLCLTAALLGLTVLDAITMTDGLWSRHGDTREGCVNVHHAQAVDLVITVRRFFQPSGIERRVKHFPDGSVEKSMIYPGSAVHSN